MTLFAAQSNARTFNYQAGDVGFVPASFGHYVENIGNTTLRYLEIFNTDRFQDVSLNQVRGLLCCLGAYTVLMLPSRAPVARPHASGARQGSSRARRRHHRVAQQDQARRRRPGLALTLRGHRSACARTVPSPPLEHLCLVSPPC